MPSAPVAESPIAPVAPVCVAHGWRVSGRCSGAPLRITDATPLAKVLVRAEPAGPMAEALGVPFGRAARDAPGLVGALVVGTAPGQWLLLGAPGTAESLSARVPDAAGVELRTVIDRTHALALVRLHGAACADLLARLCPVDLHPTVTPDGAALTTLVAGTTVGVVRDDRDAVRSYLLVVDRSLGQALFDALLDAGAEFGIDVDGFRLPST